MLRGETDEGAVRLGPAALQPVPLHRRPESFFLRPRRSSGFTLLELMVVLFLVVLVAGISTVLFSGSLPSARLDATARELLSVMKHARSRSLMNGEMMIVSIDLETHSFSLEGKTKKNIPPDINVMVIDPLAGEVTTGTYRLVFYPGGGIEGGTVVLTGKKKTVSIQTDPLAGAVMIKRQTG